MKMAKLKAEFPKAPLIEQHDAAIKELAAAKEQRNVTAEKLPLTHELSEIQAPEWRSISSQELQKRLQQLRNLKKMMRDLGKLESLDRQLTNGIHDLDDRTCDAITRNEWWVNELNFVSPEPYRSDVNGSTGPDCRYVIMNSGVKVPRAVRKELFIVINRMSQDAAFRREMDAFVGHAFSGSSTKLDKLRSSWRHMRCRTSSLAIHDHSSQTESLDDWKTVKRNRGDRQS